MKSKFRGVGQKPDRERGQTGHIPPRPAPGHGPPRPAPSETPPPPPRPQPGRGQKGLGNGTNLLGLDV